VSVEQGYYFYLVAFGGPGPLHTNAIGKLLGTWPVIIPPAPGVLCAQGDATTKLSHENSASYIKLLTSVKQTRLWESLQKLRDGCDEVVV